MFDIAVFRNNRGAVRVEGQHGMRVLRDVINIEVKEYWPKFTALGDPGRYIWGGGEMWAVTGGERTIVEVEADKLN